MSIGVRVFDGVLACGVTLACERQSEEFLDRRQADVAPLVAQIVVIDVVVVMVTFGGKFAPNA